MDGRIQIPVINYMRSRFNVDYVDVITEPSPVKAISEQRSAFQVFSIQQKLLLSQEKHNSQVLSLVAHYDCASNPVDEQIHQSLQYLPIWGFKGIVIGLWVDENWEVQVVAEV
jgi:hypothetical protein